MTTVLLREDDVNDAASPDHAAYIAIHRGLRYAYCRCGWESERQPTAVAAIRLRDKHLADNDTDFWEILIHERSRATR